MSNDGPKSWKEFKFPPSRGSQNAVYAPLPPAPSPRSITQTESKRRAAQFQDMKGFINDERCPLCGAQLEGRITYESATVYCAANGQREYQANYKYGLDKPTWSMTTHYTSQFAFEIEAQHVQDDMYKNAVYKLDLNLNKRFQQLEKKLLFSYEGARLSLKNNLSEEELLNKIKLYTLFS